MTSAECVLKFLKFFSLTRLNKSLYEMKRIQHLLFNNICDKRIIEVFYYSKEFMHKNLK
jgi:hypothetical protein